MLEIALYDAKNKLSEIIRRVEGGETLAITKRGKQVAVISAPKEHNDVDPVWQRWVELRKNYTATPEEVSEILAEGRR